MEHLFRSSMMNVEKECENKEENGLHFRPVLLDKYPWVNILGSELFAELCDKYPLLRVRGSLDHRYIGIWSTCAVRR